MPLNINFAGASATYFGSHGIQFVNGRIHSTICMDVMRNKFCSVPSERRNIYLLVSIFPRRHDEYHLSTSWPYNWNVKNL